MPPVIATIDHTQFTPDIETLIRLARGYFEHGLVGHTQELYRLVLVKTSPPKTGVERIAHGEACLFYARQAVAKKQLGEAGDWYREALQADPRAVDYRIELVNSVLSPMGLTEPARQEAVRATKIGPEEPRAWRVLGTIERELGNGKAALKAYCRALELAPEEPMNHLSLMALCIELTDYERAYEISSLIEEKFPDYMADVYHSRGLIAFRKCRLEESIELFTRAIDIGCYDIASAQWNRSLPLQTLGRYKEGWADAEARGAVGDFGISCRRFTAPLLNLQEHKPPASIHLHDEMGFGDNLAMLRYIPILSDMGYDVRLEIREELVSLVKFSFPNIRIFERAADFPGALGIPNFDYDCPLLSLPYIFGTEVDTIPWNGPYLKPHPEKVEYYKSKLPKGKKIGICWSAGIRKGVWLEEYGRRKSLKAVQFRPLLDCDAAFISLQVGPEREEAKDVYSIYDILPEDPTWDDTAAVVENLDLIITVDTATAHLCGAMGKPVWVLWAESACTWHWMVEREDSPWYPSARVFRQERGKPHYWDGVIDRISRELRNVVL